MATSLTPPRARRLRRLREGVALAAPIVLAFLASQHHALHMLLLSFGLSAAGLSFLTEYPLIRRSMLVVSLVTAAALAFQAIRPGRPRVVRVMALLSVATTLLVVGWSVNEYGL